MSRDPRDIKSVMGDMLKINRLESGLRQAEVEAAWKEVMGEVIARRTRSVRLMGSKLIVRIDSGVVKEEFSLEKRQLMEVLNEKLKLSEITEVEIF